MRATETRQRELQEEQRKLDTERWKLDDEYNIIVQQNRERYQDLYVYYEKLFAQKHTQFATALLTTIYSARVNALRSAGNETAAVPGDPT